MFAPSFFVMSRQRKTCRTARRRRFQLERLERRDLMAVDFEFNYPGAIGSGIGFEDAQNGQLRRDALESSALQFGQWFDHNATIELAVISEENENSDTIASAASAFTNISTTGFGIGEVVRRKVLEGVDLNGGLADGEVTVNWAIDWYIGADPAGAAADQEDFFATLFHELSHTFGFGTDIGFNGDDGYDTPSGEVGTWTEFDRFLSNRFGQQVINANTFVLNAPIWDSVKIAGASPQQGLFFAGPRAVAANENQLVGLYSPTQFGQGSSWSHVDDENAFFDQSLMRSSGLAGVPAPRTLTPVEKGIFEDLGFMLTTPGIVLAATGGSTIVSESGTTDTVLVSLATAPNQDVVVETLVNDPTEATTLPMTVTFTPFDWFVPQAITITGVDDALDDGDQSSMFSARIVIDQSSDEFDSVVAQEIPVTTIDDDVLPTLAVTIADVSIVENQRTIATVTRTDTSTNNALSIDVSVSDSLRVTAPMIVTIPAGQTSAEFTLAGIEDLVSEVSQTIEVSVSATGFQTGSSTFTIVDNPFPFQNPNNRFDVTDNGSVTVLDALRIINQLPGGNLPVSPPTGDEVGFYDVSGNGEISALDALLVVNEIARIQSGDAESEAIEHRRIIDQIFEDKRDDPWHWEFPYATIS